MQIPFLEEKIQKLNVLRIRPDFQPDRPTEAAFLRRLYAASGLEYNKGTAAQKWRRYKKQNRLSDELARGLCRMYLGLTFELLEAPTKEAFQRLLEPRAAAFDCWSSAVQHYASARAELGKIIRPYYADLVHHAECDFPLLVRSGWLLDQPVRLEPESEARILRFDEDASAPVSPLVPGLEETFQEFRQWFDRDLTIFNGDAYRPVKIESTADGLRLTFGHGSYFDYYNSCEILGPELARWRLTHGDQIPPPNCADLRWRGPAENAFDLTNRSAIAGITTLTIILNYKNQGNVFLRHERSRHVAVNQGIDSLVPAGTFQPFVKMHGAHARDFFIRRTVLREFAEELLGMDEFSHLSDEVQEAGAERRLEPLVRLLDDRKAHIFFLGVGLDPVSTIPELLTTLIFDYKDLPLTFRPSWEGKYHAVPLSEGNLRRFGHQDKVFSASAACARLGARHYRFLMHKFEKSSLQSVG